MIVNENVVEYIEFLANENSIYLEEIRAFALKTNVPIIKRSSESLMKTILKLKKIDNILELGTAIGYSSLLMLENCSANIDTVENYHKRIEIAKKNFVNSIYKDRVNLIEGDISQILKALIDEDKKYDFIFLDAAKAQYINWLNDIKLLLNERGILFSDNILQDANIVESRFAINKRDKTIHKRLRKYLYTISHDKNFTTSIVPIGDGVALSVFSRRFDE